MPTPPGVSGAPLPDLPRLNRERNLVSLACPQRPTWIGDRLLCADQRVHTAYGLDLDSAWSRLWLLTPETVRAELTAARAAYAAAARLTA